MAEPSRRPDSRYRKPVHLRVELVRPEGSDDLILTAITALKTTLMRRLERMEDAIKAISIPGVGQDTIDQLAARLKAANDQLASDVGSSTPQKE